jgi:hypothetical protein
MLSQSRTWSGQYPTASLSNPLNTGEYKEYKKKRETRHGQKSFRLFAS